MIRWILDRNWLSIILLSSMVFFFSSGIELLRSNYIGLIFSASLALLLVFSRKNPWISIALFVPAAYLLATFSANPTIQTILLSLGVFMVSVFGSRSVRIVNLSTGFLGAAVISWFLGYESILPSALFSASPPTELIRVNSLVVILAATILLFGLAIASGRLAFVRLEHVGTPLDQAVQRISSDRLRLEIAKQNERLEIAKDLSELLVQKISAVVSVTEGGVYSIKADPGSSERVLSRSLEAARDAQGELRRLYDYLNTSILSELATFKISDLYDLSVAYRELGYNTVIDEQGESFALNDGMELCVYKIVFESLQNIRKHAPVGTEVSITFLWVEDGLQVLVKDNGIEFANRSTQGLGEIVEGYSVAEDLEALVSEFDGATLAALRDRAAIYSGRIEATKVPGVGFTLSAIFPNLKSLANER